MSSSTSVQSISDEITVIENPKLPVVEYRVNKKTSSNVCKLFLLEFKDDVRLFAVMRRDGIQYLTCWFAFEIVISIVISKKFNKNRYRSLFDAHAYFYRNQQKILIKIDFTHFFMFMLILAV